MLSRAVCLILLVVAGRAADWPRFLGPNGDGTSPETNLVDRVPTNGLPVVFDLPTGIGYAAPSVRDGGESGSTWDSVRGTPSPSRMDSAQPPQYVAALSEYAHAEQHAVPHFTHVRSSALDESIRFPQ